MVNQQENVKLSREAKEWVKEVQECPAKCKELEQRLARIEKMLFIEGK